MKRSVFVGFALAVSIAAASVMYRAAQATETPAAGFRSLDEVIPEGAQLYLQAKDFSQLLHSWNASPEKVAWLNSDNHTVFSQSRLFLRLQRFLSKFGATAGIPADTDFVTAVAGDQSALALYDIGKLEFVYVTHLRSGTLLNSQLWQSRNKFPTRFAGGVTFFLGSDEQAKQVVAFAVAGDYFVLTTREDLMVRTLQLLNKQPERSIGQETWYSAAVANAPKNPGDLRMVLDMKKIAVEPHFRTYWVQQNITEMQNYTAAVSDLYCEGNTYREQRVLLRKNSRADVTGDDSKPVADLLRLVPADYGFYQARTAEADETLNLLQRLILPQQSDHSEGERQAPQVLLTSGETGNESDLETRIDASPNNENEINSDSSALKRQLNLAGPIALLEVQGTQRGSDDVLLGIPDLVVISAAQPWDAKAVQQAIRSQLATVLSTSALGLQWRPVKGNAEYMELDGLHPLYIAVRGKLLYLSTGASSLTAALQAQASVQQTDGATYIAAFNHARERQSFAELTRILDRGTDVKTWDGRESPQFFSRNVTSLSRALTRLESEKVMQKEESDKVFQTVTYTWSK